MNLLLIMFILAILALLIIWQAKVASHIQKTNMKVLEALMGSSSLLTLYDLAERVGYDAGVSNALAFLHRHGLVSSAERVNIFEMASERAHFSITSKGEKVLKGELPMPSLWAVS